MTINNPFGENEIQEDVLENHLSDVVNSEHLVKVLKEGNVLRSGDLVIHIEYGLGRFVKIENVKFNDVEKDFLKIEYADNASLLVPVENFDLITKYGYNNDEIKLDKLSKQSSWLGRRTKIRKNIEDLSKKLIDIAYSRKIKKATIYSPNVGSYDDFCNSFMFEPTKDQIKATNEIISDLSSGKLMDRLLCGDVGFGKTEVAIRTSFVVVDSINRGQVAVIVPTTLLCRQHYKQFCERFKYTDYKVVSLSRLTSASEAKKIKRDLELGNVDIVIGTHSLLNKDVKFKNLGLTIIDEEQRFGVKQKEKIKGLRTNTHILAMSATPIPRTLQMSISGIRDLSLIMTPPINRVNVETVVCQYDDAYIKNVMDEEIKRKGRVFIVVPRIADIAEVVNRLNITMPDLKYCTVHGQMDSEKVDILMNDFYDGKYDVLIATIIIENGIDVPQANTMIVYKANNFGLAQLYQLRGRVGRGGVQAYAYLTTKKTDIVTDNSKKRLEIIESIRDLNSGFMISSEDMNIRGVGNVLGEEQSGHIKDVGVELYNDMLMKAINKSGKNISDENKNNTEELEDFSPEIKIHLSTVIPNNYIDNVNVKMKYYREIANIKNKIDADEIAKDMIKQYGNLPDSVKNLFAVSLLKHRCKLLNIQRLLVSCGFISVSFHNNNFVGVEKLLNYSMDDKNIKIKNDGIVFNMSDNVDVFSAIDNILKLLESCI